jgi:diadenosine tetraphosphate (Ap4A) HIT family hydrolase
MKEECPFCGSAKKESRILKEGKYSYVLFSNPRFMPGHLLVIPNRHIEGRLKDLDENERKEIFGFLAEFQTKILDRLASGCDIQQRFKPYVKNSRTHVNHMHWHLHPRDFKDALHEKVEVYRSPLYEDLSQDEVERISSLLAD